MFVSAIHDMGESMHPSIEAATGAVIGDVPAGQKTATHKIVEKRVRQHIYETLLPDVEPEFLAKVESIIAHQPDASDDIVHELFEAAHTLQTFDTARRAYEHSMTFFHDVHQGETLDITSYDGGRRSALLGLHRAVFLTSCDGLLKLADSYTLVAQEIAPYRTELERYRTYKADLPKAA